MTSNFKPTYLTSNSLQKQLLNTIVGNHDLICGCDSPLKHVACLIFQKAQPTNFTEEEKTTIKKCLGEEDGVADGTDDLALSTGDLEKLFAEDTANDG